MLVLLALLDSGIEKVRALVGVEATGKPFDAFNYSDQALTGAHINPMINTGAIALCTLIHGETYEVKFMLLLELARKLSDNTYLDVDESVYLSEKETGNKNRALSYMLKAYGLIQDPVSGDQIFPKEFARYVNATLATCGMYDGFGAFALNVASLLRVV